MFTICLCLQSSWWTRLWQDLIKLESLFLDANNPSDMGAVDSEDTRMLRWCLILSETCQWCRSLMSSSSLVSLCIMSSTMIDYSSSSSSGQLSNDSQEKSQSISQSHLAMKIYIFQEINSFLFQEATIHITFDNFLIISTFHHPRIMKL